jgi:hypothetical protein
MKRLLAGLITCCAVLCAGDFQRFDLPNGATVLYQGWRQYVGAVIRFPRLGQAGNAIRRMVTADNGAILVEFDVQVDVLPNRTGFRIHFSPVPGTPFFAKAPEPREVQAGDYVLVDVLEQPGTGKRTFDSLKVGYRDTAMTLLPLPPEVPHVVASGTALTLDRPVMMDERGFPIARASVKVYGKRVHVDAPGHGQYTLSTEPGPGFRLEAMVYGQQSRPSLAFTDGERIFILNASSIILPEKATSLLWVRKEGGDPPGRPGDLVVTAIP